MTSDEKLKLEYEQVVGIFQLLTDVRFKLLAFVPTISGIAVGLLTTEDVSRWTQIGLAGLGFVVTLGVVFYDQRNTQFYNNVVGRAEHVEAMLDLTVAGDDPVGGLFRSRRKKQRRLFGVVPMKHDRGIAMIYSAVLGAWVFAAVDAGDQVRDWISVVAGGAVAVAFFVDLERLDGTHRDIAEWFKRDT